MRDGSAFAGVGVALITPLEDDRLDLVRLREQVEYQIAAGVDFLVPVGTTGESPTLSHEEHERTIAEVIQIAAGRCKIMAGTGSNSTAEALRLTERAAREVLSLPVYPSLTEDELLHVVESVNAVASAGVGSG